MTKFTKWLLTPAKTFQEKAINVLAAYTLIVIVISLVCCFYGWLYAVGQIPLFFKTYQHEWWINFFGACVIAPLAEEVFFRHLPMQIIKTIKGYQKWLFVAILFTSLVFAYMHQGSVSVPIQGVMGFILCVVYIKNGFSYWSSCSLHFMWNFALCCEIYKYIN